MPIYEYLCTDTGCNNKFEVFQKIKEPSMEYCPHCSKKSLKKVPSISTVIFKGTGWDKSSPQPKESTDK